MYKSISLTIEGAVPLLMHNGSMADPLNQFPREIKKISGKRDKTEADHEEIGRLEFLGSLWLSGGAPCIPGEAIEAAIVAGAKKKKRGNQAKAGIICPDMYPLIYDGPRDPLELWADERFRLRVGAKVGQARIMRTRPRFDNWKCNIKIEFMPSLLNESEVRDIAETVGLIIGIGDWRPRFGRFLLTK